MAKATDPVDIEEDADGESASSPSPAAAHKPQPTAPLSRADVLGTSAQENKRDAKPKAKAEENNRAKVSADAPQFIVQVGAFSDAASARNVRSRLDQIGLKSYTRVTNTSGGSRIRVRMGPYPTREEAEKALARVKAAGLRAVVLTL